MNLNILHAAMVHTKAKSGIRALRWNRSFALLRTYKEECGKTNIPREDQKGRYLKLARWILRQRQAYKNELEIQKNIKPKSTQRINAAQINLLNSIGFQWELIKSYRSSLLPISNVPPDTKAVRKKRKTPDAPKKALASKDRDLPTCEDQAKKLARKEKNISDYSRASK